MERLQVFEQVFAQMPNHFSSRYFARMLRNQGVVLDYSTSKGQLEVRRFLESKSCHPESRLMWVKSNLPSSQSEGLTEDVAISFLKERGYRILKQSIEYTEL